MQNGRTNSKIERPRDLHFQTAFCDENVNIAFKSSSDDEHSPEMNCKKNIDKPTLVRTRKFSVACQAIIFLFFLSAENKVKRLTMGLLRINDQESRPLGELRLGCDKKKGKEVEAR